MGKNDGSIVLFSLSQNKILKTIKNGHYLAVTDICISSEGSLYSSSEDKTIIEWDASSLEKKRVFKSNTVISKIALSPNNKFLASGNIGIDIWDLENDQAPAHCLKGVSAKIISLAFVNNEFLISINEEERFVNVFSFREEKLVTSLAAESFVRNLAIGPSNTALVCCDDGSAIIWDLTDLPKGSTKKKKQFESTLKPWNIKFIGEIEKQVTPILTCSFVSNNSHSIQTARNILLKPLFETVTIDPKEKELCLVRAIVNGIVPKKQEKKEKKVEEELNILDSRDFSIPTPCSVDPSSMRAAIQGDSFGDKLRHLYLNEKPIEQERTDRIPKSDSLRQMLTQALHSNDKQLLETCLNHSNPKIIENTLKKLPPNFVIPLLNQLIERFEAKPNRGPDLIVWIKELFLIHTAFLMTIPNLQDKVGRLYSSIESRVSVYNRLLKLSGKLDLVVSQIAMRNQNTVQDEQAEQPLFVYREDEDEIESEDGADGEDMDVDFQVDNEPADSEISFDLQPENENDEADDIAEYSD